MPELLDVTTPGKDNSDEYKRTETLMQPKNVYSLQAQRAIKETQKEEQVYQHKLRQMTKLELLDEMVRFQEERKKSGALTLSLMIRGRVLFEALENNAETNGMRALAGSYKRHLSAEFQEYLRTGLTTSEKYDSYSTQSG